MWVGDWVSQGKSEHMFYDVKQVSNKLNFRPRLRESDQKKYANNGNKICYCNKLERNGETNSCHFLFFISFFYRFFLLFVRTVEYFFANVNKQSKSLSIRSTGWVCVLKKCVCFCNEDYAALYISLFIRKNADCCESYLALDYGHKPWQILPKKAAKQQK